MAAFGEELRRAREERGITLEAVCESTKVSAKHIRALETGDFAELPGGIFRRGFLRSYLKVVGLEEGPWLKRFDESCRQTGMGDPGSTEWVTFAENVRNNRAAFGRRPGVRWAGMLAILTILALVGWGCWRIARHRPLLPRPMIWLSLNSWVDKRTSR